MSDPRQAGGPVPDGHEDPPTAVRPPVPPPARESEIDLLTLVIAACASAAAAFLTSLVWERGALASAAATPVIIAIVKEALRRPSTVVSQVSPKLSPDVGLKVRHHWRVALLTGLAGFAIFAAIVTVPELIAGSSLLRDNERTTLFSGSRRSAPPKVVTTTAPQTTVTVKTVTVVTTPTSTESQTTPVTPTTPQQTTPTQPPTTTTTQPPAAPAPADTTAGGTAEPTP